MLQKTEYEKSSVFLGALSKMKGDRGMFTKQAGLVRAIRGSWKSNSLKIAKIGRIVVLKGSSWRWAADEDKMTKDVLAQIVKCTGMIPEENVQYECGKDIGNQVSMYMIEEDFLTKEDMDSGSFDITDLMIGNYTVVKTYEGIVRALCFPTRLRELVDEVLENGENSGIMVNFNKDTMIFYDGLEEVCIYCESIEEYRFLLEKLAEVL